MITKELKEKLLAKNQWSHALIKPYYDILTKYPGSLHEDFVYFFSHVKLEPTLLNKNIELYHVAWFLLYSSDLQEDLDFLKERDIIDQKGNYIPLSSTLSGDLFIYEIKSNSVYRLDPNRLDKIANLEQNDIWKSFSSFIEWYYDSDNAKRKIPE